MTTKKKAKRDLKQVLTVTIAPSVIEGLDAEAARRLTSRSAIAQEAFMEYLERKGRVKA